MIFVHYRNASISIFIIVWTMLHARCTLSSTPTCVYNIGGSVFNLQSWANKTVFGPKASGGRFAASFCGDLPIKCEDALTHRNYTGALYQYFGGEGEWLCWDVLVPTNTKALASTSEKGLTLKWNHHGDAHLSCPTVSVTSQMVCDPSAPPDPSRAILSGSQTRCSWNLLTRTSNDAICNPALLSTN